MMKEHVTELNNSELEQIIGGVFVIKPTVVPKIIDGLIDIEPSSNTGKDVPRRNPEFGG